MSSTNYATTASLAYFSAPDDGARPYNYINEDTASGKRRRNWAEDPHVVNIENVRGSEDQYTLDTTGFQFGKQPSRHTRFLDSDEVKAEYYPESAELIKKVTGASRVVVFDHTIRRRRPGVVDDNPESRQPAAIVHGDQTTASSIARVHRHLPASDVPALLKRRFQILNLWRPISHAALDWPLAVCDFRSVDAEDLMPVALIYPDHEGETYGVKFNPAHKWNYKRGMEPDEYVLIKCFDSVQDGSVAKLAPHTAFQDPNTPEGTPLRESIELRVLVFYDY